LQIEEDPFSFLGSPFRNLIAYQKWPDSEPFYLIGAHFDSVEGSPGADDNASGVAALLEIARVLSKAWRKRGQATFSPENVQEKVACPLFPNVVFAFFNLEEFSMIGSTHYASLLKKKDSKLLGMISLEMIGYTDKRPGSQKYPPGFQFFYPNTGDFIGVVANGKSRSFLKKVTAALRQIPLLPVETITLPFNGGVVPASRLSDHSPFWDEGYPALLVTDTSFYRNPHYHGPTDTVETLDPEFLRKATEGITRVFLE
jgi:Zn-dependent M28 family amino/carboxypeptidase